MLKRFGVIIVWLLATLGTASLTYAAVSQAGRAVGDTPAVPVAAADIAARVSTSVASTTLPAEPSTTSATDITTTSIGAGTTTTVASSGTTTATSSPSSSSTTSTTAPSAHTEWKTVPGVGTVGVSVSGDSVTLVSAQPVAPYDVDVEHSGPDRVEVEFTSGENEYKVRAEADNGVVTWLVEN